MNLNLLWMRKKNHKIIQMEKSNIKMICMNYGKLIILIIHGGAKLLPSILCWWHFIFSTEKGFQRTISETLIFTVLINNNNYSMIVATLPEPTVRPPSRIANVRPCSIAIGWMSSIVISTLSPGMHISVPAGSSQTPVTSVVLK